MSKHTPGPWYAKEWSAKDDDGAPLCGGWNIIDRMEVRIPLSDMEGDIDEAEANALLIAAAPDLLEALRNARSFIKNGVDLGYIRMPDADCPDSAHNTLPAIEAALAKAQGDGK